MKIRRVGLAAALACVALGASAEDLAMKEQAGARFACGGVGVEERAALDAMRSQASLELLFVTQKRGGYLADVEVSLERADGAGPALHLVSEGPMCMIFVPAGTYRITASLHGAQRTQRVAAAGTGKPPRVVFAFPGEPWDGIWASDEEKLSARTQ